MSIRKSIRRREIRIRRCGWAWFAAPAARRSGSSSPTTTTPTFPRFGWIREGWAWAEVLNRKQDTMDLYFIDTQSGKSRKVLTESAPDAWVNVNDDFRILKSGDRFLWTSWRDGHTHIYLYSFNQQDPLAADAKLERQLESGDYEVLGVSGVDEQSGTVSLYVPTRMIRGASSCSPSNSMAPECRLLSAEEGSTTGDFSDDGEALCRPPLRHAATTTTLGVRDRRLLPEDLGIARRR